MPDLQTLFSAHGVFAKSIPGYRLRPQQIEMAEAILLAIRTQEKLVVEAGTGTGKTLAYLVPAIRSGRRVVISTATKSLQEQLFQNGTLALEGKRGPVRSLEQERIEKLELKVRRKDEVLAELMEAHLTLKKALGEL